VTVASVPLLPADPGILQGRLDNGLSYFVRGNRSPKGRAELRLVVNAGSLQENDDQRGLAHFLEHMAFKGTQGFPRQTMVNSLESLGMSFGREVNAVTRFDETVFKLQVPTEDPRVVDTAIRMIEEMAHLLSFDPDEVRAEAGVINEERRLGSGAEARMQDVQFPILYMSSRHAERIPIGLSEIVEKADAAQLRRFYRDWYRPDLMAVVAVGDFDPPGMVQRIRDRFGPLKAPPDPPKRISYPVADTPGTLYAPATDPEATTTRVTVYVRHEVRPLRTEADYRRQLVEDLYNRVLSVRLEEIARRPETPLEAGASASLRPVRAKDAYVLAARVKGDRIREALETLLTEVERVQRHGFTSTELESQKQILLAEVRQEYQNRENASSVSLADDCVDGFLRQEPILDRETEYLLCTRFLPAIALSEVNQVARLLFTENNRVVLVNAPGKAAAAVPGESQVREIFSRVASAEIGTSENAAPAGVLFERHLDEAAVLSRSSLPELGVTQWKLSNGAEVVLKPTDFVKGEVLFSAFSSGGASLVSDSEYVAAMTAADIVAGSGVGGLNAAALRSALAGKAVQVSPWIDDFQQGLRGKARPEDLETLFQLIYLSVTEPRRDAESFQASRQRLEARVLNRAASPLAVFFDTVRDQLFQDNPRYRPWTVEQVRELDFDTCVRLYRERFKNPAALRFFFVGDFTLEQIEPLARRYLGSLSLQGPADTWKDTGARTRQGVLRTEVRKGIEPRSRIEMVYSGRLPWSLENRARLEALSRMLEIRLRDAIRVQAGGSYDVTVEEQLLRSPDQEYIVAISFGCAPERVDQLVHIALGEIQRLREDGPDASLVQTAKEVMSRDHEQSMRDNGFWLRALQTASLNGLDPMTLLDFDERLRSITVEESRKEAADLLNPENYLQVTLNPEVGGGPAGSRGG
jgi:zinc protease